MTSAVSRNPFLAASQANSSQSLRTGKVTASPFSELFKQIERSTKVDGAAAKPTSTKTQVQSGTNATSLAPRSASDTPAAPAPPKATQPSDAVQVLQDAMTRAGINASAVSMQYREVTAVYPGGSYTLQLVTADFGNGRTENFDARAVLASPDVAAVDMQHALQWKG